MIEKQGISKKWVFYTIGLNNTTTFENKKAEQNEYPPWQRPALIDDCGEAYGCLKFECVLSAGRV